MHYDSGTGIGIRTSIKHIGLSGLTCLALLCAATAALAADIPPTANSLNHHVWANFTPNGQLPDTNGQIATGVFDYASNNTTIPQAVGPSFTVSRLARSNPSPAQYRNSISVIGEAGYAPGDGVVAGTGFPTIVSEQHDMLNVTMRYQFSAPLPSASILWVLDLDSNEQMRMQFFDCAGTLLNPSAYDAYLLSTNNLPRRTFTATDVTFTSPPPQGGYNNPTAGVVIRSSAVCRVDIVHTGTSADGTVFFSIPAPRITLTKAMANNRLANTDQFTMRIANGATVVNPTANSTSTGAGTTVTANTGTTGTVWASRNVAYTLTEAASGTTQLNRYTTSIACTNSNPGSATVLPTGAGQTFTLTPLDLNDNIACTMTNTAAARLTLVKRVTNDDQGNATVGAFGISTTAGTPVFGANTGTAVNAVYASAAMTVATGTYTLRENDIAGYQEGTWACTNTGTGTFNLSNNTISAGSITMNAGNILSCEITNNDSPATLQLAKAWGTGIPNGQQVTIAATTGAANNTASFNATSNTAANSGTPVAVAIGNVITLPAETGANVANYRVAVACTGGHTLSGTDGHQTNTLTITSQNAAVCTYTNSAGQADISITKTNTDGINGNVDQANDTVTRGNTTYVLTVINNGPDAVTGAAVTDTPVAGVTCPAGNAVTVGGTGPAPAGGPFTVANLTGAGITLGRLALGQTNTFTFQCTVN